MQLQQRQTYEKTFGEKMRTKFRNIKAFWKNMKEKIFKRAEY